MKVIVYKRPDGGVRIGVPQSDVVKMLMTKVPQYGKERAERDIALQVADGRTEADLRPFYDGLVKGKLSEAKAVDAIARKDSLPGETWRVTDANNLPARPLVGKCPFRDAWTDDNPTEAVDVDMAKARAIHMGRLRKLRNEKLAAHDLDSLRAIESGDQARQADVAEKKQALRDMPANTDLSRIDTPEALGGFLPDVLAGDGR